MSVWNSFAVSARLRMVICSPAALEALGDLRLLQDRVDLAVELREHGLRRAGGGNDCYTFVALDATRKAIISYRTGKRTADNTTEFAADLRARILGRPQISSDGFRPYIDAIEWAFGPMSITGRS